MTEEPVNGRPRWTDVLKQQELSEARMSALLEAVKQSISSDIAGVKVDVAELRGEVKTVQSEVANLTRQEAVRDGKFRDRVAWQGELRSWGTFLIAVAAILIAYFH